MNYIDMLVLKIEALNAAKSNLVNELSLCEDQEKSFDNPDVFALFLNSVGKDYFRSFANILGNRTLIVRHDLINVGYLLSKAEEELNLLTKWTN